MAPTTPMAAVGPISAEGVEYVRIHENPPKDGVSLGEVDRPAYLHGRNPHVVVNP